MKHIYVITCNKSRDSLKDAVFYSTRTKARADLKTFALDLSSNTANEVHDNTPDLFSFTVPESDDLITYSIIQIEVG